MLVTIFFVYFVIGGICEYLFMQHAFHTVARFVETAFGLQANAYFMEYGKWLIPTVFAIAAVIHIYHQFRILASTPGGLRSDAECIYDMVDKI